LRELNAMKRTWIGLGLAGLIAMAVPGSAQQTTGDTELQLQGSLSLATSSTKDDTGTVDLRYGRFLTDFQQIGLEAVVVVMGSHKLVGYGGPFYRYNFSTGKVVPYVGGSAAAAFGNSTFGKGARFEAEGGVRYFLDRRTAFTVSATTGYSSDSHAWDKRLQVLFGFSHLWGR
jgi:hypothetical protein